MSTRALLLNFAIWTLVGAFQASSWVLAPSPVGDQHTVRLVASGRVQLKGTITHVLPGLESVPHAFDITANKGKHQAIGPAQVVF